MLWWDETRSLERWSELTRRRPVDGCGTSVEEVDKPQTAYIFRFSWSLGGEGSSIACAVFDGAAQKDCFKQPSKRSRSAF
jgi:hypothetical protein